MSLYKFQAQRTFTWEGGVLENNINHILRPHLTAWGHELLGNMGLCKFQAQRTFIWESVLENNINHILRPHLTAWAIEWGWFFDRKGDNNCFLK